MRLCASVLLSGGAAGAKAVAGEILRGYRQGLEAPRPFVLEREHLWLRDAFAASDAERDDFWRDLERLPDEPPPKAYRASLLEALGPAEGARFVARTAGAGSLGRPRFVVLAQRRGGPAAREVKGRMASCWAAGGDLGLAGRLARGPAARRIRP